MRRLVLGYALVGVVALLMVAGLPWLAARLAPAGDQAVTAAAPPSAAPPPPAAEVPPAAPAEPQATVAAAEADAPPPSLPEAEDPVAAMSAAVLADLGARRAGPRLDALPPALQALVQEALLQGQSAAFIDALVNEAAARGQVEVPAELRTTEGRVDTAVLLAALAPEGEFGEGDRGGLLRSADPVAVALDRGAARYTVVSGDSLSALALRYYGDASRSLEIHAANAAILATPDALQVGQVLTLPPR